MGKFIVVNNIFSKQYFFRSVHRPEWHSTDYCASEVNHEMLAAKTRGTYSWRVGFVFVETSTILTSLLQVPAATQQEDSVYRSLDMSCNVNLGASLHIYEIANARC